MTQTAGRRRRISVVTCYFDPDYVRGTVIHAALRGIDDADVHWVRSRSRSAWRFVQIAVALLRERVAHRPDLWVLTFRGQEILPLVLAVAGRTPVIFDEFIVPLAYATQEPHRASPATSIKHGLARISQGPYRRWLRRCRLILADTLPHAALSSEINHVPLSRYRVLPVGADETLFHPRAVSEDPAGDFEVFYYGNMLPLHGVDAVLDAAVLLRDDPRVRFRLVGGGEAVRALVTAATDRGAHVTHSAWIPLAELPDAAHRAQLGVGGPFGGTPQAQRVVTGKTYQFLASGIPVLVGDNDAEPLLVDRENCLVATQQDPASIAAAIRWAADHPDELREIGERGRALYEREYSLPRQTARLAEWLDDVGADRAESTGSVD